jgi:hypothetical protein
MEQNACDDAPEPGVPLRKDYGVQLAYDSHEESLC